MKPLLLLACCKTKLEYAAPARYLYRGQLFQLGLQYGEKHGYDVRLLSAQYGWILPDTIVPPYEAEFTRRKGYRGEWPDGEGVYVGGQRYFMHAPDRFQPLVPMSFNRGIKVWITELQRMM